MKFGQSIENNERNIFLNHAENKTERLIPDLFFVF